MTPEEVLAKAAELVERGWCQGALKDGHGRFCMEGALFEVTLDNKPHTIKVRLRAYDAIDQELGEPMFLWNDAPGRTAEEVATALRNAKRWL